MGPCVTQPGAKGFLRDSASPGRQLQNPLLLTEACWHPATGGPHTNGGREALHQLCCFRSVSLFDRRACSKQMGQAWPTYAGCRSVSAPRGRRQCSPKNTTLPGFITVQLYERRKIKCLKKNRGCPITMAAAAEWSRERGGQGLFHACSIHHSQLDLLKKLHMLPSPPCRTELLIAGLTEN